MIYNFPNWYKRFGLFVENGPRLTMCYTPGEWPVAFSTIKELTLDFNLAGTPNKSDSTKEKYPTICKIGVQCMNWLSHSCFDEIRLSGCKYEVALQCGVNPEDIQIG